MLPMIPKSQIQKVEENSVFHIQIWQAFKAKRQSGEIAASNKDQSATREIEVHVAAWRRKMIKKPYKMTNADAPY